MYVCHIKRAQCCYQQVTGTMAHVVLHFAITGYPISLSLFTHLDHWTIHNPNLSNFNQLFSGIPSTYSPNIMKIHGQLLKLSASQTNRQIAVKQYPRQKWQT